MNSLDDLRRKASIAVDRVESALDTRALTRSYAELARQRKHGATEERIYFFHIRKTGGTSLSRAFLAVGGEDPDTVHWRMRQPPHATTSGPFVFARDGVLLTRGDYFFGWSHAPAWSVRLPPRTFRLTVLRDPVDRVVSLYRYLADARADDGQPFPAPEDERSWAAGDFESFLDRIPRPHLLMQLYMFSRTFDVGEASDVVAALDEVIFTPCLDEATERLSKQLGLPLMPRHERESVMMYEPSAGERARVRELLEPEYRLMSALAERGIGCTCR